MSRPPAGRQDHVPAVVELVPGDDVVTCFVPTGTSISADGEFTEGTGVPHFMGGMLQEFTVSD